MVTFEDGPAKGATLQLRRGPLFLRVVHDADGSIDALDQLDDVAQPTETIHVYRCVGKPSWIHVCRRPRSAGGYFAVATYRLYEVQPGDAVREQEDWEQFVNRQIEQELGPCR